MKTSIDHVAILVKDLEKVRAVYCKHFNGTTEKKYISKNNVGFESYFVRFSKGYRLESMYKADIHASHQEILAQYETVFLDPEGNRVEIMS